MVDSIRSCTSPVFDNVLNFRDIATLSSTGGDSSSARIRSGRVYRSARLDSASARDEQRLLDEFHIRTILDLRTTTEHDDAAENLRVHQYETRDFDGCDRVLLNFNGSAFSRALVSRLSYFHQAQLVCWYVLGWRKDAIAILARNVVGPADLDGLAADSLAYCRAEIKTVFDLLARKSIYSIVVHCTQGKDRTGLVVLLIQLLLGVDRDGMTRDYLQSQFELEPERLARVQEIAAVGMPESFADCQPDWVDIVCRLIEDEHGGIENYLEACGVDASQQDAVRRLIGTTEGIE